MNSDYSGKQSKPLLAEILTFQKTRNWLIIPLIVIGLVSLLLPFLPGLIIIFAGLMLWKPELAEKAKEKLQNVFKNLNI